MDVPYLETDDETDDEWETDQSMPGLSSDSSDVDEFQTSQESAASNVSSGQENTPDAGGGDTHFISNGAMTTQDTAQNETARNQLPSSVSDSDSGM